MNCHAIVLLSSFCLNCHTVVLLSSFCLDCHTVVLLSSFCLNCHTVVLLSSFCLDCHTVVLLSSFCLNCHAVVLLNSFCLNCHTVVLLNSFCLNSNTVGLHSLHVRVILYFGLLSLFEPNNSIKQLKHFNMFLLCYVVLFILNWSCFSADSTVSVQSGMVQGVYLFMSLNCNRTVLIRADTVGVIHRTDNSLLINITFKITK